MWWIALISCYILLQIVYPVIIIYEDNYDFFKLLPGDLFNMTKMNWFGCFITSFFLFLIFPLIWIGRFIYWLFHIKRKEKSK